MPQCFACRESISSYQDREGNGRCSCCNINDYYEEDVFSTTIVAKARWSDKGKHVVSFEGMTEDTRERLSDWLTENIPNGTYNCALSGETVHFDNATDSDVTYLAFVQ